MCRLFNHTRPLEGGREAVFATLIVPRFDLKQYSLFEKKYTFLPE